jgi:hypothetical protein
MKSVRSEGLVDRNRPDLKRGRSEILWRPFGT